MKLYRVGENLIDPDQITYVTPLRNPGGPATGIVVHFAGGKSLSLPDQEGGKELWSWLNGSAKNLPVKEGTSASVDAKTLEEANKDFHQPSKWNPR